MVAGIYLQSSAVEGWKYLGWLSDPKPSAVFKTALSGMPFQIGISIEPEKEPCMSLVAAKSYTTANSNNNAALQVLKNLYNYITSFLGGPVNDPNVAIPVRVFNEWHQGLLRKLSLDPQYLDKTAE